MRSPSLGTHDRFGLERASTNILRRPFFSASCAVTFASYYVAAKQRAGIALVNRGLYERASQVATDAVSNIRTVAAFTAEERVLSLFDSAMEGPVKSVARQGRVAGFANGFSSLMYPLPQAFAFYVGAIFITRGLMCVTRTLYFVSVPRGSRSRLCLLPAPGQGCVEIMPTFDYRCFSRLRTFGEVMQVFLALLMAGAQAGCCAVWVYLQSLMLFYVSINIRLRVVPFRDLR